MYTQTELRDLIDHLLPVEDYFDHATEMTFSEGRLDDFEEMQTLRRNVKQVLCALFEAEHEVWLGTFKDK